MEDADVVVFKQNLALLRGHLHRVLRRRKCGSKQQQNNHGYSSVHSVVSFSRHTTMVVRDLVSADLFPRGGLASSGQASLTEIRAIQSLTGRVHRPHGLIPDPR